MSYNFTEEDIRELIENCDFKTIRENFEFWTIKSKQNLLKVFEEYESNIIKQQNDDDNEEELEFFKVIKIPQDLLDQARQYI